MNEPTDTSRRRFLGHFAAGGALAAIGAGAAWLGRSWGRQPSPPQPAARQPLGDAFVYDIERFREVPEELIAYEQSSEFDPGMRTVRSIAIGEDGAIHIAGDAVVRVFEADGTLRREIKPSSLPRGLSVREENLVVGVRDHVELFTLDGQPLASFERIDKGVITSVDLAGDHVFAADAGNRIVWHYDRAGKLINRIGGADAERGIPGFVVPSPFFALRVAPDGLLRVANPGRHQIEAYTFRGDLEFSWGATGMAVECFCGCCNPVNFTILADGRFLTCEKGLPRVKLYDADGRFQSLVAPPALFPENQAACTEKGLYNCTKGGLDAAPLPDGRICILDIVTRRLRIMKEKLT